eukprot:scaffold17296_cov29-Attheya_sp.AAC.1
MKTYEQLVTDMTAVCAKMGTLPPSLTSHRSTSCPTTMLLAWLVFLSKKSLRALPLPTKITPAVGVGVTRYCMKEK